MKLVRSLDLGEIYMKSQTLDNYWLILGKREKKIVEGIGTMFIAKIFE